MTVRSTNQVPSTTAQQAASSTSTAKQPLGNTIGQAEKLNMAAAKGTAIANNVIDSRKQNLFTNQDQTLLNSGIDLALQGGGLMQRITSSLNLKDQTALNAGVREAAQVLDGFAHRATDPNYHASSAETLTSALERGTGVKGDDPSLKAAVDATKDLLASS